MQETGARFHCRTPGAQAPLDLFRGAVLLMLQPNSDRMGRRREHRRWEAALIPSPHDIIAVPEKSQLTPVIKIITKSLLHRGFQKLYRILSIRDCIPIGKIIVEARRPDSLEIAGYFGEKNSRVIYIEFIGVQRAPPILGASVRLKCAENIGPQTIRI
jgi:hypothetical protein